MRPLEEAYQKWSTTGTSEDYEVFGEELLKFAEATLRKPGGRMLEIDDAVQDAVLRVLENLDQFSGVPHKFPAWAHVVIRSSCVDSLRGVEDALDELSEVLQSPENLEHDTLTRVTVEKLRKFATDEENGLIALYLEGYTFQEIAEQLGSPKSTVTTRWTKMCERLRTLGGGE